MPSESSGLAGAQVTFSAASLSFCVFVLFVMSFSILCLFTFLFFQSSSNRLDHEPTSEAGYSVPRRITNHLGTKVTHLATASFGKRNKQMKNKMTLKKSLPLCVHQVEMVYSLLSMLGTHDKDDMSRTLLAMSSSQDSCIAMRQSGCLPLLIQLLHGNDKDSLLLGGCAVPPHPRPPSNLLASPQLSQLHPPLTLSPPPAPPGNSRGSKEARARASAALHNIVHSQPDDKRGRREIRVLHLLEQVRHYCEACWSWQENHERGVDQEDNPSECTPPDADFKPPL